MRDQSVSNLSSVIDSKLSDGKEADSMFLVIEMQGELQYFIGVQLDGSEYLEPERKRLSRDKEKEGAKIVQDTANNIDGAVRELPDANMVLTVT